MPSDLLPRLSAGSVTDEEVLRALGWRFEKITRRGYPPGKHRGKSIAPSLLPKPTTDMNWLLAQVPEGWATADANQWHDTKRWQWPLDNLAGDTVVGEGPTACLALLSAILQAKGYEYEND